jgi:hypothetical protein
MSFFMKVIGNPFMKVILRSPFHAVMSKSIAILSITGKKSGRVYTLPVNYQRDGDEIWIVSNRDRTWWRNLRCGAKVLVCLAGRDYEAWGEVYEEAQEVSQQLRLLILLSPTYGRVLKIGLDPEGNPVRADVDKAAKSRVMVKLTFS